jgi:acyl dehydratase
VSERTTRTLHLTAEMLVAYSRRGNFHSDPDEAQRLGLSGLVAQGMQVAGPAYAALLDAWGDEFLAQGELELKFVGMVMDGTTVDASVDVDGDSATVDVVTRPDAKTAVVGSAERVSRAARPGAPS